MAKRFTDTSKYKKPFFRGLPGAYKLLYDFLYHDCDHAGIWIVDMEIAQNYIGKDMLVNKDIALGYFNSDEIRVIPFDGGKKWFIPLFIKFQYTQLSEKNRAHVSVINILKKFNLIDENLSPIDYIPKGHPSPLQGDKDKVKEMEMDKEQETGNGTSFGKSENLLIPQMHSVWISSFPLYTPDKELDFPALRTIADFIFKNAGIKHAYGDTNNEIKVLNTFQLIADQVNREQFWINKPLSSISKNIQEFYNKIKNPTNGTAKQQQNGRSTKIDDDKLKQKLAAKLDSWKQNGG